jgi:hypothetical protein
MWAELIWLRTAGSGGIFGFLKSGVDFLPHVPIFLSQDRLCSTELLIIIIIIISIGGAVLSP